MFLIEHSSVLKILDYQSHLSDLEQVAPNHFTENKEILLKEIQRLKKTIQ